jgi:hypothetical protein
MKVNTILLMGALVLAAASQSLAQVGRAGEAPVRFLPDLKITLVSAKGNQAVVRVSNVCNGDAPATTLLMDIYQGANKASGQGYPRKENVPSLVGKNSAKLGKSSADIVIKLPAGTSLDGKFIRLEVDRFNTVKESSEGNNWYERGEGAAQPFPDKAGYCDGNGGEFPPPAFKLTGVNESGSGTTYTFNVSNWEKVPVNWLGGNGPSTVQCGNVLHAARMIAHLYRVSSSGDAKEAGCRPFHKNDLGSLSLTVAGLASDSAKVKLVLEDRLFKAKYSSPLFEVEPFIVLKALNALGCKTFMGNPNSFLCTSDSGFKSCEDMRKNGKPIKCTRAGKPQT